MYIAYVILRSERGGNLMRATPGFTLLGLIGCGYCQQRMIGRTGIIRRRRYQCSDQASRVGQSDPCPGSLVRADELEGVVWQQVTTYLQTPQLLRGYHPFFQVPHDLPAVPSIAQRLSLAYQASAVVLDGWPARPPAQLTASLETVCQHIQTSLQNLDWKTKQRILRLVIDQIVVTDEQVTVKHIIPLPASVAAHSTADQSQPALLTRI